jgi:hypothetical protein
VDAALEPLAGALTQAFRSRDPEALLCAYEDLWLGAWDLTPGTRREAWRGQYAALSSGLTTGRGRLSAGGSGTWGARPLAEVQVLTHGARTFLATCRWLWGQGPFEHVVDIGAGGAPASLAAWASGARSAVLVEPAEVPRAMGSELLRRLGVAVEARSGLEGTRRPEGSTLVLAAYVANEHAGGPTPERLRRWLELGQALLVLEPGTRAAAQALSVARDALVEQVTGPCTHGGPCPRLSGEDWCHFTMPFPVGPTGRALMQEGRVDTALMHVSWLSLAQQGSKRAGAGRVLERWGRPERRVHISICTEGGVERVAVKGRDVDELGSVWPGALVDCSALSSAEAKGDGRLFRPGLLAVLEP